MQAFTGYPMIYATIGGLRLGDMFITLFTFLLLLLLVKKFAWGPIMDMMQKREEYVTNEIEAAEKGRISAEQLAQAATTQLEETKQNAAQIIEEARSVAIKQEKSIIEAAREEAKRLKIAAQQDIQNEKEKALQAIQDKVASLSILIASKVIEKELSDADQTGLIDAYVKELGEE